MPEPLEPDKPRRPLPKPLRITGWVVACIALVACIGVIVDYSLAGSPSAASGGTSGGASSSSTGISAANEYGPGIDNQTAELMELELAPNAKTRPPAFTLTDQHGRTVSLASFRGKSVVLTFDDDECTDLCTLLAEDIRAADKDLGASANKVVFLAVNANPYYPTPASTKQWSVTNRVESESNWEFATGSPATLEAIWNKYEVPVQLDAKTRTVSHGSQMFFIDPQGDETGIGQYGTDAANTSLFGHAMAQMAMDGLPASERTSVGGPKVPAAAKGSTNLEATPAATVLPRLGASGTLSTADSRGKYLVLNFWSSTCAACVREMPNLEASLHDLNGEVAFEGVDVSDQSSAALAFAKRVGVSYPLVSDKNGTAAGKFQITGLPYTVVLDPKGKVVTRRAGAVTTEQLDYVLQTFLADGD